MKLNQTKESIMTFTADKVLVTPQMAAEWLAKSKGNRKMRSSNLEAIKADILAGEWRYNGDRIRFLADGTLYDGHNRLTACVEAGKSILTDIFVMDEIAKKTVDKGVKRTSGDYLAMERNVNPQESASIAASLRIMIAHDKTQLNDWARASTSASYAKHYTESAIFDYYDKNKDEITKASSWAQENVKRINTVISKSQVTAIIAMACRDYTEQSVHEFMKTVITGYGIVAGSTQDHLRNMLVSAKMGQRKLSVSQKTYTLIKAMKSVMAGRTIKVAHNVAFRATADLPPRFTVK